MTQAAPAGWYPNPENPAQQRYWDGAAWTQNVAPSGAGSEVDGGPRSRHDEYSEYCFKVYLLHLARYCGMEDGENLPRARSALAQHWANNMDFFRFSNVEKQVRYVKKQLTKARKRIAKEASSKWAPTKWSSEDLAKYALTLHNFNTVGQKGSSHADWVVRRKVELLEQVAILEVCDELGIDLFDGCHEGRE